MRNSEWTFSVVPDGSLKSLYATSSRQTVDLLYSIVILLI